MVKLHDYQLQAVNQLKTGSILNGGVGSGKSLTSLWYYYTRVCVGIPDKLCMGNPTDLYIITTARKRDTCEWEKELANLCLSKNSTLNPGEVNIIVDSWNNISKYVDIKNSFFIFDEQRVVGYGAWTKSFLKIAKQNDWILLSATPGDTWMDYAPVFIANGFYKNRTEFIREHVIYNNYVNFPQIKCYINCSKLVRCRDQILVNMDYHRDIELKVEKIYVSYDEERLYQIFKKRWDFWEDKPIENSSQLYFLSRKVVNSGKDKLDKLYKIYKKHKKIIVFYNFDYELSMLEQWGVDNDIPLYQWNGHQHEPVPGLSEWVYLVQYSSGAEGWNCIDTNIIVFYSLSHSYKQMLQASGRINRCNSPFNTLYYYVFLTDSVIDNGIINALSKKKNFNSKDFERLISQ